jgi:hypothetical protein
MPEFPGENATAGERAAQGAAISASGSARGWSVEEWLDACPVTMDAKTKARILALVRKSVR